MICRVAPTRPSSASSAQVRTPGRIPGDEQVHPRRPREKETARGAPPCCADSKADLQEKESVHEAAPCTDDTRRSELLAPEYAGRRTGHPPCGVARRTALKDKNHPVATGNLASHSHLELDNPAAFRRHGIPVASDHVHCTARTFEALADRALPSDRGRCTARTFEALADRALPSDRDRCTARTFEALADRALPVRRFSGSSRRGAAGKRAECGASLRAGPRRSCPGG